MAFLDFLFISIFLLDVLFPNECKWGANINAHNLLEKHLIFAFTSRSKWMQLRSILNCTQLTWDANTTYNMIHFFRMNTTKEHTQLHITYSRCIISQALFIYIFFSFSFFFDCPHPLLKSKCLSIMAIVFLKLPKSLRKPRSKPLPLSLKHN